MAAHVPRTGGTHLCLFLHLCGFICRQQEALPAPKSQGCSQVSDCGGVLPVQPHPTIVSGSGVHLRAYSPLEGLPGADCPPNMYPNFSYSAIPPAVRTRVVSDKLVSLAPHRPLNTSEVLMDITNDY